MSEKRFTSSIYQDALSGVYDRKENLTVNECCNLLNQLAEENEELRKQNEELINSMQETARLSANAITKTFREIRLGNGVDYD